MRNTGVGFIRSDGAELGQVKEVVICGGHFVPVENLWGAAVDISKWLGDEMDIYGKNEERRDEKWSQMSTREKQMLGKQGMQTIKEGDVNTTSIKAKI